MSADPKGRYLGRCNRTACQQTPALFFNEAQAARFDSSCHRDIADAYYCVPCGRTIATYAEGFSVVPPSDPRHPWYAPPLALVDEPTEIVTRGSLHGPVSLPTATDPAAVARGNVFRDVRLREPSLGFGAVGMICGWTAKDAADVDWGRRAPADWEALWARLGRRP